MFTTFIGIIVGFAVVAFGAKMMMMPMAEIAAATSQFPVFLAGAIAVVGLYKFMAFAYTKRKGIKNRRHFWEGICYLLIGAFLGGAFYLRSGMAELSKYFGYILVLTLAVALILTGLFRMIHALVVHKNNKALRRKKTEESDGTSATEASNPKEAPKMEESGHTGPRARARKARTPWVAEFLVAILIVVIGAICAANPFLLLVGSGTLFGINVIFLGALIIWDSFEIK